MTVDDILTATAGDPELIRAGFRAAIERIDAAQRIIDAAFAEASLWREALHRVDAAEQFRTAMGNDEP